MITILIKVSDGNRSTTSLSFIVIVVLFATTEVARSILVSSLFDISLFSIDVGGNM